MFLRFIIQNPLDRVWLVDDVMTSGAALNKIARVLKQSGVAFVGSLTLARRLLDP